MNSTTSQLNGEYANRGAYHRELDPNWVYYPTYVAKMRLVRRWVKTLPDQSRVLDAGCGEGVLVDEFAAEGTDIQGLDLNCESERVRRGSLTEMPFDTGTFDALLCLDVLEHLPLSEQRKALHELVRITKPGGRILITVPNLGHLANRLRFLIKGHAHRTAKESKHPGDRVLLEWLRLVDHAGLRIVRVRGIFPTVPIVWRWVRRRPAKRLWMHQLLTRLLPVSGWGLCSVIEAERPIEAENDREGQERK